MVCQSVRAASPGHLLWDRQCWERQLPLAAPPAGLQRRCLLPPAQDVQAGSALPLMSSARCAPVHLHRGSECTGDLCDQQALGRPRHLQRVCPNQHRPRHRQALPRARTLLPACNSSHSLTCIQASTHLLCQLLLNDIHCIPLQERPVRQPLPCHCCHQASRHLPHHGLSSRHRSGSGSLQAVL